MLIVGEWQPCEHGVTRPCQASGVFTAAVGVAVLVSRSTTHVASARDGGHRISR